MLQHRWQLISVLFAASLVGPQVVHATDFGTPVLEVVDASALKGIKRVAVTSFTVQYVTAQVWDTSHTTGGGTYRKSADCRPGRGL